jgi:hypothetical protein
MHSERLAYIAKLNDEQELSCGDVTALIEEVKRLRNALHEINEATQNGTMNDDIVWFSDIETLSDFCMAALYHDNRQPELPGIPVRDEDAIAVGGAIYEETCQIAQDDEASGHLTLHATRFMRLGRAAINAIQLVT